MRKGIDHILVKVIRVNSATGEREVIGEKLIRPPHGHRVLAKRHRAKKAAKQARKVAWR